VINNGQLTLGDGGKMKLHTNMFPIGMVELMNKKILVHADQAEAPRVRTWSFPMIFPTG
jgi:hypothetical protein